MHEDVPYTYIYGANCVGRSTCVDFRVGEKRCWVTVPKKGAAIGRLLPPPPLWVHLFDDSGKIREDGSTSPNSF